MEHVEHVLPNCSLFFLFHSICSALATVRRNVFYLFHLFQVTSRERELPGNAGPVTGLQDRWLGEGALGTASPWPSARRSRLGAAVLRTPGATDHGLGPLSWGLWGRVAAAAH